MLNILVILLIMPMHLNDIGINRIIEYGSCKTVKQLIPIQTMEENRIEIRNYMINSENRGQMLWQYADASAIAEKVSITPDGKYIWVFQGLNNERLQLFDISSSIPNWDFSLSQFDDPYGTVDSWSGNSDTLLAASIFDFDNLDTLYVYRPGSNTPIWKKSFPPSMWSNHLKFSEDGSKLTLAYYNSYGSTNKVFIFSLNALTGDSLWACAIPESSSVYGLDVSENGNIIFLVTRHNSYVFESGTLRWSCTNPYESCCCAMSSNGQIICRGDYYGHLYTYYWNGSSYQQKWSYYIPPTAGYYNWLSSVDISESGKTIIIGSLETITTGDAGRVSMFDSSSATPLWEYLNCGGYVPSVSITPDGEVAIAGSWGDIPSLYDDILVFDNDSGNPIYSYSSPGSIYSVDISDNGEYAVAGGKAVHASIMGNGGYVYAIKTDHLLGVEEIHIVIENNLILEVNPSISKNNFVIHFSLNNNSNRFSSLQICDISGRTIHTFLTSELSSGNFIHSIVWDGTDDSGQQVFPGAYFVRLITDEFSSTTKILLMK